MRPRDRRRAPATSVARVAAGVAAGAAVGLAAGCSGDVETGAFSPRGDSAADIAVLWWAMLAAGTVVLIGVTALLAAAARGRRHRDPDGPEVVRRSGRLVIGGGIVLPVVVLVPLTVGMLVVGARITAPVDPGELEVHVIGHQYWWEVRYPDTGVVTANEVHIPAGRPVLLRLETADVIHSFWVPRLAGKLDMIPGQVTELRINAREPGEFVGACAEFCGLQHARMRKLVIAQPPEEFEAWLAAQARSAVEPATGAARRGAEVFARVGCAACHTVRGTDAAGVAGPDLTHVATRRTLGALTVPNTRGQLAGWVVDPQAVKPGNLMPPTALEPAELLDLLAYLEGLG